MSQEGKHYRLYLDTCALHGLALCQPWAENQTPDFSPYKLGVHLYQDYIALYDMFRVFQTSPAELVFSDLTLEEISYIPQKSDKYRYSLTYIDELLEWMQKVFGSSPICYSDRRREVSQVIGDLKLDVFPDQNDRIHLSLAILSGCNFFVTVDYKTIIRYRGDASCLPIAIVRPIEYCMGRSMPEP